MSDDSIRDAFTLEENNASALNLSLPAAQQKAKQNQRRQSVLLTGSTVVIASVAAMGVLYFRPDSYSQELATGRGGMDPKIAPGKGRAVFVGTPSMPTPQPTATPSAEWLKMFHAYTEAKNKGVFLDITYPLSGKKRNVWRKGNQWRDETSTRIYGSDGRREWVWKSGARQVITWRPERLKTEAIKFASKDYSLPHLLNLLDVTNPGHPKIKSASEGKELIWSIEDFFSASLQTSGGAYFRLNADTYLPQYEKYTYHSPYTRNENMPISIDTYGTTTSIRYSIPYSYIMPPPSFLTFPRTLILGQLTPKIVTGEGISTTTSGTTSTPEPTPTPALPVVAHTVRASYNTLPPAGFGPPPGVPIADLDAIQARWETRLKQQRIATVESLRYQAVIRHASQDSQGNIYLIYTGDALEPEIFRKQLIVTLEIPGYNSMSWMPMHYPVQEEGWLSDLSTILPDTLEGQPLRQLTLMPLKPSQPRIKAITLRLMEKEQDNAIRTRDIAVPLTNEPYGPECMTVISGLPTAKNRNTALFKTFWAAVTRAAGHKIQPETVIRFETIARDNWKDPLPWEISLAIALLAEAADQQGKAYQHATHALAAYQKTGALPSSDKEEAQRYNALNALLTRLAK